MMNEERAEVIWSSLTYTQRIALLNMLFYSEERTWEQEQWKKSWSKLSETTRTNLRKLDWSVSLGINFPQ